MEAAHVACEVGVRRSGAAGSLQRAGLEAPAPASSRPSAACPQQLTFFSLHMDLGEEAARLLFFFLSWLHIKEQSLGAGEAPL